MPNPKIIKTEDGSHTLKHATYPEHYHSTFGAIQESQHIFIKSGLEQLAHGTNKINVFEVGFGTGLNALLTYQWANDNKTFVNYLGIEAYPISLEISKQLNYPQLLNADREVFSKMHYDKADEVTLSKYFVLQRITGFFEELQLEPNVYNLVYFDAFSPDSQPELWTESIFSKLFVAMKMNGVLTTYSTKGIVKRALKSSGFKIEKLPGPPGKREILRAIKI
jgi:tRNA U34 5-methylaminomethyl-2-thiouridine-forming methyltransferase MnmC